MTKKAMIEMNADKIRKMLKDGIALKLLAERYGVSQATIYKTLGALKTTKEVRLHESQ